MAVACSTAIRSEAPLEEAFAAVSSLGIPNVDILCIHGWVHFNPGDAASDPDGVAGRIESGLKKHALNVVALNSGLSVPHHDSSASAGETRRCEVQALIGLMKRLGITVAALQPGGGGKELAEPSIGGLREICSLGADAGVTFALELHFNSPFDKEPEARRVLAEIPALGVAYDPSHWVMQGVKTSDTAWQIERATHVHLRDAANGKMQVPYGTGEVDFDWILETLKAKGYSDHIAIECLQSSDFNADESAKKLYEKLAKHFV